MPAITSGRVLVTGANGYVAVWVLKYLLERSFTVRGTIRSESKGAYLRELFKAHGDKLEVVVVPDITKVSTLLVHLTLQKLIATSRKAHLTQLRRTSMPYCTSPPP